jgi:hypothetical protein
MEKVNKRGYECNIAPELWDAWKKLKRRKDPQVIAKKIGVSRPVIDRALIYGNVAKPGLAEKINKFFETRQKEERKAANRLNGADDGQAEANEREAKAEM